MNLQTCGSLGLQLGQMAASDVSSLIGAPLCGIVRCAAAESPETRFSVSSRSLAAPVFSSGSNAASDYNGTHLQGGVIHQPALLPSNERSGWAGNGEFEAD